MHAFGWAGHIKCDKLNATFKCIDTRQMNGGRMVRHGQGEMKAKSLPHKQKWHTIVVDHRPALIDNYLRWTARNTHIWRRLKMNAIISIIITIMICIECLPSNGVLFIV